MKKGRTVHPGTTLVPIGNGSPYFGSAIPVQ